MAGTREFHIGDILSVTTGHLVSPRRMDGLYDLLGWMTGDTLFTHQLPRAARECEPSLREQFPDLAAVTYPDGVTGEEPVAAWLAAQVTEHGHARQVAPLAAEDHTHINPVDELRMMAPDAEVIAIVVPEGDE